MIFAAVGSREYPSDRLSKELDELYEDGTLCKPMFVQMRISTYQPKHYKFKDFISSEKFIEKISEADIVILHGVSGSIVKTLNAGKKVIAITHLEKYGKHINDHQIQDSGVFDNNGYVLMVGLEPDGLDECFKKIYDNVDGVRPWENRDPMAIVNIINKLIRENW